MPNISFLGRIILFLKGVAMGAADVVPGVSGGTIAFVAGIYEELVETIDKLSFRFFKIWKRDGFKYAWREYNLSFLLTIFAGVAFSIVSLAKVITYLLATHPVVVWAFFFGLILASIVYIVKQMDKWTAKEWLACILTAVLAYLLTIVKPLGGADNMFFFFFAGFVGIIAMILPGVSGAFILLLIGAYIPVLGTLNDLTDALKVMDTSVIFSAGIMVAIFILGMLSGIKVFSRILTWLFNHYKNVTFAVLTGFMIGSLNKIWPWKQVLEYRVNSKGEEVPFLEKSVWPMQYGKEPFLLWAILFMLLGFIVIFGLEYFAARKRR